MTTRLGLFSGRSKLARVGQESPKHRPKSQTRTVFASASSVLVCHAFTVIRSAALAIAVGDGVAKTVCQAKMTAADCPTIGRGRGVAEMTKTEGRHLPTLRFAVEGRGGQSQALMSAEVSEKIGGLVRGSAAASLASIFVSLAQIAFARDTCRCRPRL